MNALSETALEAKARRAAKKVGLMARKSRWRIGTIDNLGGFQVVDPFINAIISGEKFDMTADDVIEFCRERM
jgi:hypothetical protein